MQKTLGTIEVILDDSDSASHLESYPGNPYYRLVINKRADSEILENDLGLATTKNRLDSIVAHELGHAVSYLLDNSRAKDLSYIDKKLPEETYAWQLAKVINPNLDEVVKNAALGTYRDRDEITKDLNRQQKLTLEYLQSLGEI